MGQDLEEAMKRLSSSDRIEDQVNIEIIRYWNDRVHQDDTTANRAFRKLMHEFIFEDAEKD